MNIALHKLGRRFDQEWIFRNIDFTFSSQHKYAILGPNGSGKSTLLKVIAGQLTASEGQLSYHNMAAQSIHIDDVYQHVAIAAPYLELIEEFTLNEMLDFHFKFKEYLMGYDKQSIIDYIGLSSSANKMIKYYSSGMKQRVKLALACFSASNILLLDEPTSNFDTAGEKWYLDLVELTVKTDRLLIVGSNQEKEYSFCDQYIRIMDFK